MVSKPVRLNDEPAEDDKAGETGWVPREVKSVEGTLVSLKVPATGVSL
mgnify:CR=1 FL=1|jgi:hypothetical protein